MALFASWARVGRRQTPRILLCTVVMAGWFWMPAVLRSAEAERPPREFQVKAVFLYNFAQFVEWPTHAFADRTSPLRIGVLGMDPFGPFLDELVRGEKVNGRPLVVERYRSLADVSDCHVLFVSGSEGRQTERIAEELRGRSILTVCDWEEYARNGAIVWFVMERNRVRLRINLDAAKAAGLTISSKLLRSAEIVTNPPEE